MAITLVNPAGLPEVGIYRQVSVATGSTLVHVAGQVAEALAVLDRAQVAAGLLAERRAGRRLGEVLAQPGDRLLYTYDYGDEWNHRLVVEAV